jgi:hypothetical protein
MYVYDKFWYEDYNVLFDSKRFHEFCPSKHLTYIENLNALVRFSIYCSILLFLIGNDYRIFYLPVMFLGVTFLFYKYHDPTKLNESFSMQEKQVDEEMNTQSKKTNIHCKRPTIDNPFMNPLLTDYKENPNTEACTTDAGIQDEINEKFDFNLYRSYSDVFKKESSDRQFFTMPSTTIPNKRHELTNWLYNSKPTLKERHLFQK